MAYATVERRQAYNKAYYLRTREQRKAKRLLSRDSVRGETPAQEEERRFKNLTAILGRHGLTLDKYHSLLEKQDFCCGVCGGDLFGADGKAVHIDHDHATGNCVRGKVRGLLCVKCNVGLGCLEDGRLFSAALRYLGRAARNQHTPRRGAA